MIQSGDWRRARDVVIQSGNWRGARDTVDTGLLLRII